MRSSLFPLLAALSLAPICASAQSLSFDSPAALGFINTDKVTEASGIAVSLKTPNVFWTHNDGSSDHIYAFNYQGALLGDFDFSKNPTDIEDIATGPGPDPTLRYLYIGDIGSNAAKRDVVHIFRLAEPDVDPAWAAEPVVLSIGKGVENFALKYPDGKNDAEAMLIDPLQKVLYIATKQPGESRLYQVALNALQDGQTRDLEFVRTIAFSVPSGGAISPDGLTIAIRREDFALAWIRSPAESVSDALAREGTVIPVVGTPIEPNGEGISFLPDNSGYLTISEGANQPVYLFRRQTQTCDAPRFSAPPAFVADGLQLTFTACPNSIIAVERSSALADWQQIGSVTVNNNPAVYKDIAPTAPGYYRLRVISF